MPLPELEAAQAALAKYLDEHTVTEQVADAAKVALRLVADRLTTAEAAALPDEIGQQAVVEAGAAVYYRRTARNGIATFGGAEVVPMRISKDPLSTVYPLLAPYTAPGLA